MNYAEALKLIESSENGLELAEAIKSRVESVLEEKKNFNRRAEESNNRVQSLESLVEHLTKIAGAEGDDPEVRSKSASAKIQALGAQVEAQKLQIADLDKAKTTAERSAAEQARYLQITDAAIAASANPTVLRMLAQNDEVYEVQITGEGKQVFVTKGETRLPVKEYAQVNWADFMPSLFPSESTPSSSLSKPSPTQLPSGLPSSMPQNKDLVGDYIRRGRVLPGKK